MQIRIKSYNFELVPHISKGFGVFHYHLPLSDEQLNILGLKGNEKIFNVKQVYDVLKESELIQLCLYGLNDGAKYIKIERINNDKRFNGLD